MKPVATLSAILFSLAAGAAPAGPILAQFPGAPDPSFRYVVYLHGRIVEEQGRAATSPDFGPYRLDDILGALAGSGAAVIGEVRPEGVDPEAAAAHVVAGVRELLAAGVPAGNITIVGASKGALIAMLASTTLASRDLGWVVMASCNDSVAKDFELSLHGRVLSIYEASDSVGGSCAPVFGKSPALAGHDEIRIDTGLRHGFLYQPHPEWVKPALAWIEHRRIEP